MTLLLFWEGGVGSKNIIKKSISMRINYTVNLQGGYLEAYTQPKLS